MYANVVAVSTHIRPWAHILTLIDPGSYGPMLCHVDASTCRAAQAGSASGGASAARLCRQRVRASAAHRRAPRAIVRTRARMREASEKRGA